MASKAATKAAGGVMSITTKQTLQSTGVWERFRAFFALDPNRSNGVPLNPYFRHPAPGQLDPLSYTDPVTAPAGDIAANPYWKRDHRRNYPRLSVIDQAEQATLLTLGSAAAPRIELIGEEGMKAVVSAQTQGKEMGLAATIKKEASTGDEVAKRLLGEGGLPPRPCGQSWRSGKWDVHKYGLDGEQSYTREYTCRSFQ